MMGVTTALKPRRALKIEKPRPLKLSITMGAADHNLESVLGEMDLVSQCLQSGAWDQRVLYPAITSLCENLKMFGPQLENVYKDQLDKCYIWLRTGCRDDRLSLAGRYRLLEIIELRAMNWKPNQNLISYYQTKLQHIEAEEAAMEEQTELAAYMTSPTMATMATTPLQTPTTPSTAPLFTTTAQQQQAAALAAATHQLQQYGGYTTPAAAAAAMLAAQQQQQQQQQPALLYSQYHQTATMIPVEQYQQQQQQAVQQVPLVPAVPLLSPGEVVRTSGKFSKPTRIAGKNYCKDEVVIRNQDSGKVMGIKGRRVHMIEELSETIISFQRVAPGARERLVQITGPTEENINQAKQLIEDTIRRNASPVREAHSLSSGGSSVFGSSPLNGSNSSIASHTDDDNNSLTGCKRNTLVHSISGSVGECAGEPACMGDYRYTVTHNNNPIRITGNNLSMVRTAKLVLDEYFNGERNLNNIAQLIAADGDNPDASPLLPPLLLPLSPAPSSSSPPLLVKPATPPATPPPPAADTASAPGGDNLDTVVAIPNGGVRGDESPKNGGVGILRQPLFPSSSKDAMEAAEGASSSGSRVRRAAFAKTYEERQSTSDAGEVALGGDSQAIGSGDALFPRGYTRKELLQLSDAACSKLTPLQWATVVQLNPELVKKGSACLAGVLATMTEGGDATVNGVRTYLPAGELFSSASLSTAVVKVSTASLRSNSITEEDNAKNSV